MADPDRARAFGAQVDFGRAADDYGTHRAGFPERFFERLAAQLGLRAGMTALDIGTGAGTVAFGLAALGLRVTGVDPSEAMLAEARGAAATAGLAVDFRAGRAEALEFPDQAFDIVTAGQCWHWFDRPRAAAEAFRVVRPGGALAIAHFDWIPERGSVVAATEALIEEANPAWKLGGGRGVHPRWLADLSEAGFADIETASFDHPQPYTHEGWRGRIRASAGIKASLAPEAVAAFDAKLAAMLARDFPDEPLLTPHRVWWATGRRPPIRRS
jgi:ubiquinone/menaquinone biosynthesis C-methylase UbiE